MEATQVILRPLITEKANWEAGARNRYSFEVHEDADKIMIREAVQEIYKVRVLKVSTQNRHSRYRKTKWGVFQAPRPRKAVVELHPEDKIDLF